MKNDDLKKIFSMLHYCSQEQDQYHWRVKYKNKNEYIYVYKDKKDGYYAAYNQIYDGLREYESIESLCYQEFVLDWFNPECLGELIASSRLSDRLL